jgi:hypothetical protein
MDEYKKQANDFCEKYGVKIVKEYHDHDYYFDGDKQKRAIWKIQIKRNRKTFSFKFGNSLNAGCEEPSNYDILACLTKYDVGTIENFMAEFGYEIYSIQDVKKVTNMYKAVCEEYKNVIELFSDCMEELWEIQ